MCLVTRHAPVFATEAVMPNNSFATISLSSWRGKYVRIFFYPLDFTFVCPSEILAFNRQLDDFKTWPATFFFLIFCCLVGIYLTALQKIL